MTHPRFLRRRRERKLALAGDFPDSGETVTEILDRVRPASYDDRTYTWQGASGTGLPEGVTPVAIKRYGQDTEPIARLRARSQRPDTFPALPPAGPRPEPGSAPNPPVLAAVPVTEPAVIGDELRLPIVWCEMPRCISWHHDPESLGERDSRDRAVAAGWRPDAFGRLTCPQCQQRDPAYRVSRAAAWHHPGIRRLRLAGQPVSEQDERRLAAEAEYGRRISLENPALACDIAEATRRTAHGARHGRPAGGAR